MTETRVDKKDRKKLKVTWVKPEVEKFGRWGQKLRFNCDDGLQYETIKSHLFEYIKKDAELDAETELQVVIFDDKGEMPKWVVTEIYQDSKPILAPVRKEAPQPERRYGRDEDRVDERTFVMETGQDLRAGIIDKNHPFFKARETILASWVKLKVKEEKPKAIIDMGWLQDSIKKLWKTNRAFVQWVGDIYRVPMGGSVQDIINRLTIEQQEQLNNEIKSRLKLL